MFYPGPYEHDATFTVAAGVYASASGNFTIVPSPSTQTLHFTPGGTATANFTITGLPNFVTIGTMSIPFNCSSIYTGLDGAFSIKVWLLDATPIGGAPGNQVPVWAEILDSACLWSTGLAGPVPCRVACTYGVYGSAGIYDYSQPIYYVATNPQGTVGLYRLKAFLDTFSFFRFVDCQDVAAYFAICNAAIGVPTSLTTVTCRFGPAPNQLGFRTNPLKGVGHGSYTVFDFSFHAQATSDGLDSFDACAAQEYRFNGLNVIAWNNPIPGWSKAMYWQFYGPAQSGAWTWGGLASNLPGLPGNSFIPPEWNSWTVVGLL